MNKKILTKAAEKGIIDNAQIKPLLDFFETEQAMSSPVDNSGEQLKFIRSFGDIFIALGVFLLAFTSNQLAETLVQQLMAIVGFFVIAEWLVGHKRLVLPGMATLLSILFFVDKVVNTSQGSQSIPISWESLDILLIIVTSLLFYIRYRMPFSLYPVAVGCIFLSIELSGINVVENPYVFIILGLVVFIIAMWYDSRDTQRISSLSDNGFWLHLLAAPLIVHGVMVTLFLTNQSGLESHSLYILLLFTLFFFIALFVDRRAILVSSFVYALYAVFKFAYQQFMQIDNLTLFIFMGVGLFVIFFGTYWYKVRTLIFSPIASLSICKWVPDFNDK
ncbi:MAG: hypothetical protein OQL19_04715 [Gammaproteobacteria bacterium]|nr:hypothetical protein [Gammaproteobacteria bacterium]